MSYYYNLGQLFNEIARSHSSNIALKFPEGPLIDYNQLNNVSNQLGRFLIEAGCKKNCVVAIFNEKSFLAYALMLACLKSGLVYTNLDTSSPWPRLRKIVDICRPSIVFFDGEKSETAEELKKLFPETPLFNLTDADFQEKIYLENQSDLESPIPIHGGDPAYIMFTSGSTGFPKGAVMSHDNVLNFIKWTKQTFKVVADDVFTSANPVYFDNSVFDFYASIFNGATLVPLRQDLVKNVNQLVKAIDKAECTIWFSVPSLLVYLLTTKALSKNDFKTVKRISFGGEGFPKNKLKQLFDLFSHRIKLFNVYGPTECTCICSSHMIVEADFENMNELATLGNIAANFGYEIIPLDTTNENFGELALTGPCVGLGYYNDKERTEKSFIQNPRKKFSQIMYKTGDVVEVGANGNLHFKGRIDNQIKHMGYRIELEEIEAAFSSLKYVNEVGVIYQKITPELGQIKAFVSINDEVDESSIVMDLKRLLPPYMIPRVIEVLNLLPKNANGKIDRKQLAMR